MRSRSVHPGAFTITLSLTVSLQGTRSRLSKLDTVSFTFPHGRIEYDPNSKALATGGFAEVRKGQFFPADRPGTSCAVALKINNVSTTLPNDQKAALEKRIKVARTKFQLIRQTHSILQ